MISMSSSKENVSSDVSMPTDLLGKHLQYENTYLLGNPGILSLDHLGCEPAVFEIPAS